ncbi:aldo/keto reductase [Catalinimonas niigatensis]|uniref:aldo/keto reductase n=1 Tax=Catalinimonas niigatensis TaxID=1397264 RepID=UPI002666B3DB|nr:aldo/keto reductase [Catalinimonas niigatensis]WPP48794.1 aldo/keto reductase [Catalinimonas niigatensis]
MGLHLGHKVKPSTLDLSSVIFGTSSLGDLFEVIHEETKYNIVSECVRASNGRLVFDSAGKYGAGLALEVLGKCLKRLGVSPKQVMISNKLGWLRTELTTEEPTFEPGVWKDIKHDAVQKISYDGIMECFEQGNELLGGYAPQMVSVHDPDEYLASARDEQHAQQLYEHILQAYQALEDLKLKGKVKAIGVGAKDWKVIQRIVQDVPLDWVMFANSMTIKTHPQELIDFIRELHSKNVAVINSAVFHSGFLVGGDYFDYKLVQTGSPESDALFCWREKFAAICERFEVVPAAACVQFALQIPGVTSIAMNATKVNHVIENIRLPFAGIPSEFWKALKKEGLISHAYSNGH